MQTHISPLKGGSEGVVGPAARTKMVGDDLSARPIGPTSQEASKDDDISRVGSRPKHGDVMQSIEHAHDYVVQVEPSPMYIDEDDDRESSDSFQAIDRGRLSSSLSSSPSCSPPPTPTPAPRPRPRHTAPQLTPSRRRQVNVRMTRPSIGERRAADIASKGYSTPLRGRIVQSEPKKKIRCLR